MSHEDFLSFKSTDVTDIENKKVIFESMIRLQKTLSNIKYGTYRVCHEFELTKRDDYF